MRIVMSFATHDDPHLGLDIDLELNNSDMDSVSGHEVLTYDLDRLYINRLFGLDPRRPGPGHRRGRRIALLLLDSDSDLCELAVLYLPDDNSDILTLTWQHNNWVILTQVESRNVNQWLIQTRLIWASLFGIDWQLFGPWTVSKFQTWGRPWTWLWVGPTCA